MPLENNDSNHLANEFNSQNNIDGRSATHLSNDTISTDSTVHTAKADVPNNSSQINTQLNQPGLDQSDQSNQFNQSNQLDQSSQSYPLRQSDPFEIEQNSAHKETQEDILEQSDLSTLSSSTDEVTITQPQKKPTGPFSWWTLKNKATLLAVALGTLPVLVVGGISTSIAGKQLSKEAIEQQQQFTNAIAFQLQDFGSRQQRNRAGSSQNGEEQNGEEIDSENFNSEESADNSLSERILNYTEVNNLSSIINERIANLRQGTSSENNTLRFNVVDERRNKVLISNQQTDINTEGDVVFPEYASIRENGSAATFKATSTQDNQPYLVTYTPVKNIENVDNDLGVLVYQPISEVFAAQQSLVLTLLAGTIITALLVSVLAAYLANRATQPIIEASMAVEQLGRGKFDTRLEVLGNDELAILNSNINVMAEQLEYQLEFIQDTAKRQGLFQVQATLAQESQKQRAALQQSISQLVDSVSSASEGDLTTRAAIAEGELGTLGNLFNFMIENLADIVAQAKQTTWQIESVLGTNQGAMRRLAIDTQTQAEEISSSIVKVENLSSAVEAIRAIAKKGEKLVYDTTKIAQRSNQEMEQSTHSLSGISQAMSEASSKVKQMNAATQQIHQVISLLNEISLKTNLLAINASIEKRQNNNDRQDFSIVAGEIGQLTEQSTRTTHEIERIVKSIQENLKEITSTLELCTAQATDSEAELSAAKTSVEQLLNTSEEIDELLHTITDSTTAPTATARSVVILMQQMLSISKQTANISEQTETALISTAESAQVLLEKASQFKVDS